MYNLAALSFQLLCDPLEFKEYVVRILESKIPVLELFSEFCGINELAFAWLTKIIRLENLAEKKNLAEISFFHSLTFAPVIHDRNGSLCGQGTIRVIWRGLDAHADS